MSTSSELIREYFEALEFDSEFTVEDMVAHSKAYSNSVAYPVVSKYLDEGVCVMVGKNENGFKIYRKVNQVNSNRLSNSFLMGGRL